MATPATDLTTNRAFAQPDDKIAFSPEDSAEAINSLDSIMAEVTGTPPAAPAAPAAAAEPAATDEAAKAAEAAAAAEEAKAAEAAQPEVKPKVEAPAPDPAADEAAKAAEKAKADEAAKAAEGKKDDYDNINLPPHTSDKAKDNFNYLKKVAREREAKLTTQVTELSTRAEKAEQEANQLRAKTSNVPEEVTKELEDLRKFKLAHEVESDPQFRQFDSQIKGNVEGIFKKLASGGLNQKTIDEIKAIGVENVEWEPILKALPFPIRTYIEAKLVENVNLADKKDEALTSARENATAFMTERAGREAKELTEAANHFTSQLPWIAERQIPANATPEQKAGLEAHNKGARDSMALLQTFLKGDISPARMAEFAVGTVIAYRNKAALDATTAKLDAVTKAKDEQIAKITKDLETTKTQLNALKNAEVPRTLPGTVSSQFKPAPAAPKPGQVDFRSGEEALADYEREAAAAK